MIKTASFCQKPVLADAPKSRQGFLDAGADRKTPAKTLQGANKYAVLFHSLELDSTINPQTRQQIFRIERMGGWEIVKISGKDLENNFSTTFTHNILTQKRGRFQELSTVFNG
ncbi:MAG: hypothetical protein UEP78_00665 [Negativibacillus sp.]|nr:hypothetical protein [Negativibacillus sp.]